MGTSPARGANLHAIAAATGRPWADWTAWLDDAGAREAATHGDIAALALQRMREPGAPEVANPEWWAQGVTVAYEQHIGRRVPGQRADGTFHATASRTVAGTREDVHARLLAVLEAARADDDGRLRGLGPAKEPTTTTTAKRTFWRAVHEDGSRTELAVQARPPADGKPAQATVTATQSKVASAEEAAVWKAFWKDLLGKLGVDSGRPRGRVLPPSRHTHTHPHGVRSTPTPVTRVEYAHEGPVEGIRHEPRTEDPDHRSSDDGRSCPYPKRNGSSDCARHWMWRHT